MSLGEKIDTIVEMRLVIVSPGELIGQIEGRI
jgi:hypothetical protein